MNKYNINTEIKKGLVAFLRHTYCDAGIVTVVSINCHYVLRIA